MKTQYLIHRLPVWPLETGASYLHLGDGSLRRVVEIAQSIQLPAQLAEEVLELILEVLLRIILRHSHGFLQELHGSASPTRAGGRPIDRSRCDMHRAAIVRGRFKSKAINSMARPRTVELHHECTHYTQPSLRAEVLRFSGDIDTGAVGAASSYLVT